MSGVTILYSVLDQGEPHFHRLGRRTLFGAHIHPYSSSGGRKQLPTSSLGQETVLSLPDGWTVRAQGERGTCVAHAAVACAEYTLFAAKQPSVDLSEQFVHFEIKEAQRAAGIVTSRTWLREAADVLSAKGVCAEEDCPYDPAVSAAAPDGTPPSRNAANAATRTRFAPALWARPDLEAADDPGAAYWAMEALRAGKAVAMTIPVQAMPTPFAGADNWNTRLARLEGVVGDPREPWDPTVDEVPVADGHAVCIIGFTPTTEVTGGGWFIVRNSWGLEWASNVPSMQPFAVRALPGRGYGAVSAQYVDRFCSELMTLEFAEPPGSGRP
jgi:hypothetical protein